MKAGDLVSVLGEGTGLIVGEPFESIPIGFDGDDFEPYLRAEVMFGHGTFACDLDEMELINESR